MAALTNTQMRGTLGGPSTSKEAGPEEALKGGNMVKKRGGASGGRVTQATECGGGIQLRTRKGPWKGVGDSWKIPEPT